MRLQYHDAVALEGNNMKRIFQLIFWMSALSAHPLQAQWVQTIGPYGGNISCFAVDSTSIFAGTASGGVFLSTNDGQTWVSAESGLINTSTWALAADGVNLFAGTNGPYGGGLFASTDNGANWTALGFEPYGVRRLVKSGSNLYAAAFGGLFLSTNGGANWDTLLTKSNITALAVNNSNLFVAAGYDGVYRSTNKGLSWTLSDSGLTDNIVNTLVISGTNLFVGTTLPVPVPVDQAPHPYGGVFLSTNNGENWMAVDSGLQNTPVTVLAVKGADVFAGTSRGVFLSTNNGTTWAQMNNGLTDTNINVLAVKGTKLFAGTGTGIYLSTNNGESWTAASTGITGTSISALGGFGSNIFAGENGIQLSTDSGNSWLTADSGIGPYSYVDAFAQSGPDLFAGMRFQHGILRSTNNGTSWSLLDSGLTNLYITCLTVSGSNLFVGDGQSGNGVFLSTNNGANWTAVDSGLTNTSVYSLAVIPGEAGAANVFAGTQNGGVFLSTNNGKSWSLPGTGLSNEIVFALAVEGTRLFAATGEGVYLSTDNGKSWAAAGLTNNNVSSLIVIGGYVFAGTVYTGVSNGGIFLSGNNGANWKAVDTGMTNTNISSLAVIGSNLFAGTYGGGVWKRYLNEMIPGDAVRATKSDIPTIFSLSQNYPNPFNPTTTISFALPTRSYVSLKIFDMLGREVSTIVQGELQAGAYTRRWNAAGMASGVYFYRLQAGIYADAKKLMLLK